jgi:peptide/nickel transport system permease protein
LDIYYGCIWGTRTAFIIGVLVVAFALVVGIALGALAGYYGGVIDELLMRFTDIVLAFPGLILAMALVIALPGSWPIDVGYIGLAIVIFIGLIIAGRRMKLRGIWSFMLGLLGLIAFVAVDTYALGSHAIFTISLGLSPIDKIMIALALVGWPGYTRVIRGEILRIKQEDFVEASKAVGCSDFRIILNHILPNAIYPVLIMASLDIGGIVLTAAALSFLGIGEPAGYADWGQMISLAEAWVATGTSLWTYWYVWIVPGIFIFTFVMGWNLLGDAFRDILDPTLRRR